MENSANKTEKSKVVNKMKFYAIFDKKSEKFFTPNVKPNNACALRDLESFCKNKNSLIGQFPKDFSMYYLGYVDEDTGEMFGEKQLIGEAQEYVEIENN